MALLTKAVNGRPDGALAQLVERYTGSVEVRGSTPLGSTIFAKISADMLALSGGNIRFPSFVMLNLFQHNTCRLPVIPEASHQL